MSKACQVSSDACSRLPHFSRFSRFTRFRPLISVPIAFRSVSFPVCPHALAFPALSVHKTESTNLYTIRGRVRIKTCIPGQKSRSLPPTHPRHQSLPPIAKERRNAGTTAKLFLQVSETLRGSRANEKERAAAGSVVKSAKLDASSRWEASYIIASCRTQAFSCNSTLYTGEAVRAINNQCLHLL